MQGWLKPVNQSHCGPITRSDSDPLLVAIHLPDFTRRIHPGGVRPFWSPTRETKLLARFSCALSPVEGKRNKHRKSNAKQRQAR